MTYAAPLNILLVDDDDIDLRAISRAFRKRGIDNAITAVRDGVEALSVLRGETGQAPSWPYIMLVDINMPRMNGIEFLEALRADPKLSDTVAFVLTTSDDERDMAAAYRLHVAGYVLKTDAGEDYVNLASMIKSFAIAVRFPRERETCGA